MENHRDMFDALILLLLLLSGGGAFLIHNTEQSLCLEDSVDTAEVLLKKCNLDSDRQEWIWKDQVMLMCVASSRCLWAQPKETVQTRPCQEEEGEAAGLLWDCDRQRLISRTTSLLLSVQQKQLALTSFSKNSLWRSVEEGDICQERLRLRRDADEFYQSEDAGEPIDRQKAMTEEQREFLQWFYRIEDPTTWKFVLLGLAFFCLLIGFLLLGMGAMANKSRKKISKYKAAACLAQKSQCEELQGISSFIDNKTSGQLHSLLQSNHSDKSHTNTASQLTSGNIMVTWKDGNTFHLYSDPAVEKKSDQREEQEEKQEQEEGTHEMTEQDMKEQKEEKATHTQETMLE